MRLNLVDSEMDIRHSGLLYENHYPYRQMTTSRNIRHSPIHEKLASHNACFGEASGWERPNWFAPKGVEPKYEYSFGKQNWFEYSAAEHKAGLLFSSDAGDEDETVHLGGIHRIRID